MTQPDPAWEDRCERCGRCCFEKIDYEGTIYYTPVPCDRLDLGTGLCSVYPKRHEVRPGCAPITVKTIDAGVLPADCPYVKAVTNYPAPVLYDESDGLPEVVVIEDTEGGNDKED